MSVLRHPEARPHLGERDLQTAQLVASAHRFVTWTVTSVLSMKQCWPWGPPHILPMNKQESPRQEGGEEEREGEKLREVSSEKPMLEFEFSQNNPSSSWHVAPSFLTPVTLGSGEVTPQAGSVGNTGCRHRPFLVTN